MRIKGSLLLAVFLSIGLGAWMYTGEFNLGGQLQDDDSSPPIAEREAEKGKELFKVRYVAVNSQKRDDILSVRGRTVADAIISVRAETGGILKKRLFAKGETVKAGDLVCVIDRGTRESKLSQAAAQLEQTKAEYESNLELKDKGFASVNRISQLKAALDAARANFAEAEQDLARTEVFANASGIVQDPIAKIGDVLNAGSVCVTLTDNDPMLFTGQVSELRVDSLKIGMPASVDLITGTKIPGKLRYISNVADANTRTFEIEIELEKGKNIRDGVTAEAKLELAGADAFKISPSWITLSDNGQVGVRTVSKDNLVNFVPVKVISQTQNGFWVTGLEDGTQIISLGQEYVSAGTKVEAIKDTREAKTANNTNAPSTVVKTETQ